MDGHNRYALYADILNILIIEGRLYYFDTRTKEVDYYFPSNDKFDEPGACTLVDPGGSNKLAEAVERRKVALPRGTR
jgi:hypothetical protein